MESWTEVPVEAHGSRWLPQHDHRHVIVHNPRRTVSVFTHSFVSCILYPCGEESAQLGVLPSDRKGRPELPCDGL